MYLSKKFQEIFCDTKPLDNLYMRNLMNIISTNISDIVYTSLKNLYNNYMFIVFITSKLLLEYEVSPQLKPHENKRRTISTLIKALFNVIKTLDLSYQMNILYNTSSRSFSG